MAKDLTPYAKSEFQIKMFMHLYKNIRKVSFIVFVLITVFSVIGWFMLNKDVITVFECILASILVSALFAVFLFIIVRTETNPYKFSWVMFAGMISFSIGVIYNFMELFKNSFDGLSMGLLLIMLIWTMIVMQKFAMPMYEKALSDDLDDSDDFDNDLL